jgi:hypothetical protein
MLIRNSLRRPSQRQGILACMLGCILEMKSDSLQAKLANNRLFIWQNLDSITNI